MPKGKVELDVYTRTVWVYALYVGQDTSHVLYPCPPLGMVYAVHTVAVPLCVQLCHSWPDVYRTICSLIYMEFNKWLIISSSMGLMPACCPLTKVKNKIIEVTICFHDDLRRTCSRDLEKHLIWQATPPLPFINCAQFCFPLVNKTRHGEWERGSTWV